ncbi:MAG: thrombospondin type 3 repeat-containing protein [Candidatus Woesearchaeota archaeon]
MKAAIPALMLIILSIPALAYTITSTHVRGIEPAAGEAVVAFVTYEDSINSDLTGDGDTADYVLQYYSYGSDRVRNTGREARHPCVDAGLIAFEDRARRIIVYNTDRKDAVDTGARGTRPSIFSRRIAFATSEKDSGDLNGDSDDSDTIIQYYDLDSGLVNNTGQLGERPLVLKDTIVFDTPEDVIGKDLNRDDRLNDNIIRYYDLDDGDTESTGIPGVLASGWKTSPVVAVYEGGFLLVDLDSHKAYKTNVSGNDPSIYSDMIAYEKNGMLFVYRISTGVEIPLKIAGTDPSIFRDAIAFIDEEKEIAILKGEDPDNDNIPDYADNCPASSNKDQEDSDRDGTGNACDNTPNGEQAALGEQVQQAALQEPPQMTASAVAQPRAAPEPVQAAEQPKSEAEPRRELPEPVIFQGEKKEKSPAYWFLVAVGITMIGIIVYLFVPRWLRKKSRGFGF